MKMVTPAEVEKFLQLYAETGSISAVAKKCHRTPATVSRYIVQTTDGISRNLTRTELRYIKLYETKKSYTAVAKVVNKSPQTVARVIQKAMPCYQKTQLANYNTIQTLGNIPVIADDMPPEAENIVIISDNILR